MWSSPDPREAMKAVGSLCVGFLLAVAVMMSTTTVAAAAPSPVRIVKVQYDSPGRDTRTNVSLNAEHVVIKNVSRTTQTLTGWTLRDAHTGDTAAVRDARGSALSSCAWTPLGTGARNC